MSPVSSTSLAGRRVLVVGASSGIGRAAGITAVADGARVAFAGRRQELLDSAVAEAEASPGAQASRRADARRDADAGSAGGPSAVAVRCDVTSEAEVAEAVARTIAAFGGLDAVIYASAIDPLVRIADVDGAAWARLLATNVVGASLVTRAALPHLQQAGGRVLYISATSVGRPLPGMGAYAASKAALEELARAWRSEHRGVAFGVVAVGMTLGTGVTDSWDRALLGELSQVWNAEGYLLDNGPGTMEPEEVADSILAVLAAPTLMPYVSVLPDPAHGEGLR